MSKAKQLRASNDFMMKSVIICDDLAFVEKASATLQRIGGRPDVGAGWTIKTWPTSSLKTAVTAEQNLNDAADAHLIIISAQHAQNLPSRLREWLEQWAALRQIKDAALAVIKDGVHDFTKTVSLELTMLVQRHGLNLILDEWPVARDATRLIVRFPRARELPHTLELRRVDYAVTRNSFRGFGINE